MAKCFISYSWDSKEHKGWEDRVAETLRQFEVEAVYDQNRAKNPKGGDIGRPIREAI